MVEDCASDVFLLDHMLRACGHSLEIESVPRLIDAFQALERGRFDVILLDLNLRDIDGLASVAALCSEAPHTPVIVYSGMANPKTKEAALLCGAKDYLVKGHENGASLKAAISGALS